MVRTEGRAGRSSLRALMKPRRFRIALALLVLLPVLVTRSDAAVDDRAITVHSAADVEAKRLAVIQFLWGRGGFPADRLPDVVTNVPSPVKQLGHLARTDEFRINM